MSTPHESASTPKTTTTLAILGMGLMGSGLAEAAVRRGDTVRVWNRTFAKAKALEAVGARPFADIVEAVRGADRIHIILSDDASVDGVLETLRAADAFGSAIVIDHTTVTPAGVRARAESLGALGVPFLHVPVFMSPKMCLEGGGIMMASGPEALFARVADGLRAMTGRLEYMGARVDAAAGFKLFGNAMILTITAGLADVFAMATSMGIDAPNALELFGFFNPTGTINGRGKLMAAGDYTASFELAMARKDVRLMIETAGAANVHVLPAIAARMDALLAAGHGADDVGVLAIDAVPARG